MLNVKLKVNGFTRATSTVHPATTTPTMSGENDPLNQFPYAPGHAYEIEVYNLAVKVMSSPTDTSPFSGIHQGGNRPSTPEHHSGTPAKGI